MGEFWSCPLSRGGSEVEGGGSDGVGGGLEEGWMNGASSLDGLGFARQGLYL